MVAVSPYIAGTLAAIALLLLLGALWVSIRGMGGITALRQQLMVLQTHTEQMDVRLTREVKTRAGLASAEKRDDERSLLEQAQAELTKASDNVTPLARPKRSFRRDS